MSASVVLADDHPLVLDGLERLFDEEPEFRVVARCVNGEEALRAVRRLRPEILVLDLRMAPLDGLGVLRRLRDAKLPARAAQPPPTHVVVLTAQLDADELEEALELGIKGIVFKDTAPQVLIRCLRRVLAGGTWLEEPAVRRLLEQARRREDFVRSQGLTQRETELVRLIALGKRNKDAATELGITEGTVKIHLHRIYEKLGVDGRLALAVFARDHGLV